MKNIIYILLLVSFAAQAQRPVRKPKPGKVVQVTPNITPAAPTTPVVNDVLDTYSVTLSSGYGTTDHEYTLNGGSSTTTLTSLPVSVGDVAKAIGQVGIRVKAATGRNASAWLYNTTAFTVADEGGGGGSPTAIHVNMALVYGITSGTGVNNTTALMQFNTDYQSEDNLVIADFRNVTVGEVRYSDASWLYGLDSVKVWASGHTFRCTSSSPFGTEKTSFTTGGIFWQNRYGGTGGLNVGYKFNTVSAGSSTVTLNEAGWSLSAGDRVYICGYEEQGYGEPVNPRFMEWKTVASVASSTITFTTPIVWRYDANWKDMDMPGFNPPNGDGTGPFGKPRLYKIPSTYARYIEFVGCIFGKGTTVASDVLAYFFVKGETVIIDSCTIQEDWPSETKYSVRRNSIIGAGDLDKNVGLLEYNNCDIAGLNAATGVDSLRFINNTITGNLKLSPRAMYLEGNTLTVSTEHNITNHPEGTWIERVRIKNNTFTHTGGAIGNQPHIVYYTSTFTTTTGTNSSQLIVADDGAYNPPNASWSAIKAIGFGSTVTSTGRSATVTNITHNGTNWVLTLSGVTGTPASGQTWTYGVDQKVISDGGNTSTNGYDVWDVTP